ncbi:MAG: DUF4215 domain-containing protein [Candidatus Peregrinibacteria bacterium]|nr:DUF4215 domain-containing protein [Candidatus Peregrinibacteria bacterium]
MRKIQPFSVFGIAFTLSAIATFSISGSTPTTAEMSQYSCGNGVVEYPEHCDDGNTVGKDGCTATCTMEWGFSCPQAPNESGGTACAKLCGNGQVDESTNEQCDDGNTVVGDGCNEACRIERRSSCEEDADGRSICTANCGNGNVNYLELCDDANRKNGDGCNASCNPEKGWDCRSGSCTRTCGNGKLDYYEQCDDGNTKNRDGCSALCKNETSSSSKSSVSSSSTSSSNSSSSEQSSSSQSSVAATGLSISIDGPVQQYYTRQKKDAVLANIVLTPSNGGVELRRSFIAIEAATSDNRGLATTNTSAYDNVHEILEDVELRNVRTGQTIRPTRLTLSEDLGTSTVQTYQIYYITGIVIDQKDTWEVRGDFIDNSVANSPRNGDGVRVHMCTEPTDVNGRPNPTGCTFGGLIKASIAYQMIVVDSLTESPLSTVTPRGTITGNFHRIASATLSIAVKATGSTDTAVKNSKNVNLLRFEGRASEGGDVLLTRAQFVAQAGSLLNAQNYMLWADTDQNSVVDTIIQRGVSSQGGKVTFDSITGGGFVIPREQTVLFEVHADIPASLTSNELQLAFDTATLNYVEAERVDNGASLAGVSTNGVCASSCEINVFTTDSQRWILVSQGDLFVTKDTEPLRNRQLLGGTLADPVLRLQLHAENEAVDVTDLQFTSVGSRASSVDRLELYKQGETSAFATATVSGCGSDQVPTSYQGVSVTTFCSNTESNQLVVPEGSDVDVIVRPRMKSDVEGAVTGEQIQFFLSGRPVSNNSTGEGAVRARGYESSNNLSANDGDNLAEGEVFIGTNAPGANADIVGKKNVSVLAKITSITNANPDANGTDVPTGVSPFGQFKIAAAAHSNSKNGMNKVVVSDLIFNVTATNVQLSATDFFFYNKGNSVTKHSCSVIDGSNQTVTGTVQGAFLVRCQGMNNGLVNVSIDQGTDHTFVLEGNILNAQVSSVSTSTLQVSLQNFNDMNLNGTFGASQSHIQWIDTDTDTSAYQWIEYPETVVKSTSYQS